MAKTTPYSGQEEQRIRESFVDGRVNRKNLTALAKELGRGIEGLTAKAYDLKQKDKKGGGTPAKEPVITSPKKEAIVSHGGISVKVPFNNFRVDWDTKHVEFF